MGLVSELMHRDLEFDWRSYANCLEIVDTGEGNPFFVEGYGANYPVAREYCSNCLVVIDCLMECLIDEGNLNEEGMWGCMSPNERRTAVRLINKGMSFKAAVERLWDKQRNNKRNGAQVPGKEIWNEWDGA